MYLALYSVLGVAFYEAIRIYRCFLSKSNPIPDVGLGVKTSRIVYVAVLLVFVAVAYLLSAQLVPGSRIEAFLFGVGIPTGTRFITPPVKVSDRPGDVQVDDLETEEHGLRAGWRELASLWLQRFNV